MNGQKNLEPLPTPMEDLITHALKISERTFVERESDMDSLKTSQIMIASTKIYEGFSGFVSIISLNSG